MKKLPKKYAGVLFSFYASTVMVRGAGGAEYRHRRGLPAALVEIIFDYLAGGIRQPARRAATGGEMGGGFGGGLRLPENMNKAVTTPVASKCRLLSVSQKRRFS